MLQVFAGAHDVQELLEGVPGRQPRHGIRRQVATSWANTSHSELPASNEVAGRVNQLRLAEVGIPSWHERRRDVGMASSTVTLGVDEVTAYANQRPVLPLQIQRNGCNGQALSDPLLFGLDPDPVSALGMIRADPCSAQFAPLTGDKVKTSIVREH